MMIPYAVTRAAGDVLYVDVGTTRPDRDAVITCSIEQPLQSRCIV